jgi:hypothetical protein
MLPDVEARLVTLAKRLDDLEDSAPRLTLWTPAPMVGLDRARRLAIVRVSVPPVPKDSAYPRLPPGVSVAPEAPGTIYVLEERSGVERGWVVHNDDPSSLAVPGWPDAGVAMP